ncbi:complex I NDUFA9 subunit family protein [Frateuria aurantia]
MIPRRIVVLGGSGFVGHQLLALLAHRGHQLVVLSRHPERHRDLAVLPGTVVRGVNLEDPAQLAQELAGADAVVNLVGILNPSGRQDFAQVHVELPRRLIAACKRAGVAHLHQMSALKAGQGLSSYLKSRGETEQVVRDSGLRWTLYRPSLIFGHHDSLVRRFAGLLRTAPVLPLPRAQVKLAPTWVGDVAEAMLRCIEHPLRSQQQTYELYGPEVLSLGQLVEAIRDAAGLHTRIIELGDGPGRLLAQLGGWLPGRPMSLDNFQTLRTDSVGKIDGYAALGITPQAIRAWLPLLVDPQASPGRMITPSR